VKYKNKNYNGYLFVDMITALAIVGILMAGFAVSLDGFRRFNHYQLVRQHCIAAAQAELDGLAITGKPISEENFKQLWPKINISIEKTDGAGQWEGLKLVKVKTKTKSFNRDVEIELSRYILAKGEN
jgi:type II secretory pathway pseudopilin PulG